MNEHDAWGDFFGQCSEDCLTAEEGQEIEDSEVKLETWEYPVNYFWVPNRQSDPHNFTDLQNPLKLISIQTRISAQDCKTVLSEMMKRDYRTINEDLSESYFLHIRFKV